MKYKAMRFENICRLTDYLNDNNIKPTDIVGIYVRNQSQTQSEFDLLYIESDRSEERIMSREEAIKVLKEYLALDEDIDNEYLEAQRVAIKSLEQEPALDKIRTEIEKQDKWLAQAGYNAYNVDIAFNSIKRVAAESEDTE